MLLFGARDDDQRNFTAAGLPDLRLTGLEPVAAAALLQETAPGLADRVRDQLVTRTTGNPLALLELPAMLTAAQRAGIAALPEPLPLGRSVEHLRGARLSAVAGRPASVAGGVRGGNRRSRDRLAGRRCPEQRPGRA